MPSNNYHALFLLNQKKLERPCAKFTCFSNRIKWTKYDDDVTD